MVMSAVLLSGQVHTSALELNEDKVVAIALENSEQMQVARNSLGQADMNKKIARAAYLPNFSGNATGMWRFPDSHTDMGISLRMKGIYMAGINLSQPIFAGGKIVASNRMASIGKTVAEEQLRHTRIQVTANAMITYWSYVAVMSKVEMMQSYRAQVDEAFNQTRAAVDAGMATNNEMLRIDARRSQVIYQQEQVSNGAELCRMALCNVMGLPIDTDIVLTDTIIPADIPVDIDSYNLEQRPEARLLRADVAVKEQQVRMARADYLPQLGLQAGWSTFGNLKFDMMQQLSDGSYVPVSQRYNSNGWSVMLSLQVPLFHWGEGYNKVKSAKIDVENSRLNLEYNMRQLDLQVQQAITNVRTGRELVHSAEVAFAQAEAALSSTSESYSLGLATITDLLDAQSQWHSSRAGLIEARTQLRINIVDYYTATAAL